MNFNKHLNLEGQHAFLSASKYHWINYDETKLIESYSKFTAAQKEQNFMNLQLNVLDWDKNFQSLKKR